VPNSPFRSFEKARFGSLLLRRNPGFLLSRRSPAVCHFRLTGFIGIDIFFVISGFLITGIIARELDQQRFGRCFAGKLRDRRTPDSDVAKPIFRARLPAPSGAAGDLAGIDVENFT
jgi:hypothetical protein